MLYYAETGHSCPPPNCLTVQITLFYDKIFQWWSIGFHDFFNLGISVGAGSPKASPVYTLRKPLRATPMVFSMWFCKLKLDEEKSKHENRFSKSFWASIFAQFAEVGKRHAKLLHWLTRQTLNSINEVNMTDTKFDGFVIQCFAQWLML